MGKGNKIMRFIIICGRIVGISCGLVTIFSKVRDILTSETPAEKRRNDEESYKRKRKMDEEAHKAKEEITLEVFEKKKRIIENYKYNNQQENCNNSGDNTFERRKSVSLKGILENAPNDTGEVSIIGKYLSKNGFLMIYSPDGEGKSSLATQMCLDIANGTPCLFLSEDERNNTPKQTIIQYDNETEEDDYLSRYGKLENVPDNFNIIKESFDNIEDLCRDISAQAENTEGDLCISLDSLTTIIPSLSKRDVNKLFNRLKELQHSLKKAGRALSFILINHTTKDRETFYGSSLVGNITTCRLALQPCDLGSEYKVIKVEKMRKTSEYTREFIVKRVEEPWLHYEFHSRVNECNWVK